MLYILIIVLHLFCLYHAYSRRVDFWWFVIIFIFPFVGCTIYLYYNFYSQRTLDTLGNIADDVRGTVDNSYETQKLPKQLDFSDTAENKLKLGREYLNQGHYQDAYELFNNCNNGAFENDAEVLSLLVDTSYLLQDYDATIKFGEHPNFLNDPHITDEKVSLAWAYHYRQRPDDANRLFNIFDKSYGNYYQTHEYLKYLLATNQESSARERMTTLLDEISLMDRDEHKLNAAEINSIRNTASEMGM